MNDRFRFVEPGNPLMSPDGRWVLFTQSVLTLADNRRHTTNWLSLATGSSARPFLREGDRILSWARDSRSVYFFRRTAKNEVGSDELFEQGITDTCATQRSRLKTDLGYNWRLSRDGSFFLFARGDSTAGPGADLGVVFVDEGSNGQTSDTWSNLWRFDLRSGEAKRITNRAWVVNSADLSPDGKTAVVAARPDNGRNTRWKSELYLVDMNSGTTRQLTTNVAPEHDPTWFPDGTRVLFNAVRLDRWEYGNGDFWVVDTSTGATRNLTAGHFGRFGQPVVSPDGASIFVGSGNGTTRFPVQIDVASGKITPLIETKGVATVGSWSEDLKTFAYRYQDGTTPPDLYVASVSSRSDRQQRLTDLNSWIRQEIGLGGVQVVEWKSTDGLRIQGLLTMPALGSTRSANLPLIVHVPCGPGCGWVNEFSLKNQLYAGLGYAQLSVLVRGSSNYDDRFMQAIKYDLGGGDLRDLLTGADAMIARGVAHRDSLAIDGWSYGAVLGGYALTKTTRFKAASLGAIVSDWIADFGASVHYDLERWFIGGTPWSNPQQWRERSSITHANRVTTPTLLHSGDNDEVTWPFHSMNYFAAIRYAGTPSRLIRYPGEGHDLQMPQSLRVRDEQDVAWMQRFVRALPTHE